VLARSKLELVLVPVHSNLVLVLARSRSVLARCKQPYEP
jgi:hypothetical protein